MRLANATKIFWPGRQIVVVEAQDCGSDPEIGGERPGNDRDGGFVGPSGRLFWLRAAKEPGNAASC